MRIVLNIVGILMLLSGAIWFLQGISLFPGSFMTGSMFWAVVGLLMIVGGVGVLVSANRQRT
jgi:hypothetical protein